MSFADFEAKAEKHRPRAAFLVHIGGHIAFESEQIAAYCREHGIFLIEDCAHAHGASWNGRRPGSYGDAGVYSLYATKTVSTGEGGVLVSTRPEVIEHARAFRNYGKPSYEVAGLNFRMSEFTAALGLIQVERLPEIVAWKNRGRARAARSAVSCAPGAPGGHGPPGSTSTSCSTGSSARRGASTTSPATGSWAAPIWSCRTPTGSRVTTRAYRSTTGHEGSRHRRLGLHRLARRGQAPRARTRAGHLRPSSVARGTRTGTVDTVLGSITDREALERALHSCDAVAHLAAVADVNDVHASPEDAERVNARGTVAVLEAARRAGVKRIVYASTIWVYSDCEGEAVDEETLLPAPSHLYTSTKLAGELYCKAYQELYGIDYTILRFGIPYGPRAREAAVIPAFVGKALRGEALTLAGDGSQSRRFVYVEDLADGVASGLDDVAANRVYNLASDENVSIKQIAETVRDLIGDVSIEYTPARPGDFGGKVVCSRRALEELGWSAATPFTEGVRRYIEWRRAQAAPSPEVIPGRRARRRGRPAQGPDHLRRHRRGPRPAGARGGARVQGRGPRRADLDRQRPAGDGDRAHAHPARELGLHVPVRALVVRLPVPAVHVLRADAVAVAAAALRARPPGPDAPDPRPRPGLHRLHVSGRDRGARRVTPPPAIGRALLLVDHRPRRPALLGAPRDRPALHHPSRVRRGGRADRRTRLGAVGQAADQPGVPGRALACRRPARAGAPGRGQGDFGIGRRLGRRRPARSHARGPGCASRRHRALPVRAQRPAPRRGVRAPGRASPGCG